MAPHILPLYSLIIPGIICLNQIDTPPAALLAELQKP